MTAPTVLQNATQRRASYALDRMASFQNISTPEQRKAYRRAASGLPASILMNGLGQALALLRSQSAQGSGERQLYQDVETWLIGDDTLAPYPGATTSLLRALSEGGQHTYVRAQAEALAMLEWLKRLAKAEFEQ